MEIRGEKRLHITGEEQRPCSGRIHQAGTEKNNVSHVSMRSFSKMMSEKHLEYEEETSWGLLSAFV
jgi:hypothetical protein